MNPWLLCDWVPEWCWLERHGVRGLWDYDYELDVWIVLPNMERK